MRQFSNEHVAAVVVTALAAVLLVLAARRRGEGWAVHASYALAVVIAIAYATEYLVNALDGTWSARFNLPLQLTDAVALVSIVALCTARQVLVEVLYFWALTASIQAVITPDLDEAFPSLLYFTYFIVHSGAVTAACLLVFGRGLIPRAGAMWRAYGVTAAFAVLAGVADLLTGGNYMFLREKPVRASLLDVMGPWPWYIVAGAVVALALFLALAWPARALRARGRGAR